MNTGTRLVASIALLGCSLLAVLPGCAISKPPPEDTATSRLPVTAPFLSTFAVYAERGVLLGPDVTVMGGGVGVVALAAIPNQMVLERSALVDPSQVVFSPSIALGPGAAVGLLEANVIHNTGGSFLGTTDYNVASMPPVPLIQFPPSVGGNVLVGAGETVTLTPGNYDNLTVAGTGTVYLSSGAYFFTNVILDNGATLYSLPFDEPCPIQVNCLQGAALTIADNLVIGDEAVFAPYGYDASSKNFHIIPPPASELRVTVAGNDSTSLSAVEVRSHATVYAIISAPGGSLTMADHVTATGAFSGFNFSAGWATTIQFDTGLIDPASFLSNQQQLHGYFGPPPYNVVAPIAAPAPKTSVIDLDIGLPTTQVADKTLPFFISQVSDPRSSDYRHYLNQAQFADVFGAPVAKYDALQSWASASGFVVDRTYPNRLLLSVHATVAQVEQALHANLVLRRRFNGSLFVTVDRDPSVSLSADDASILWISGLDDFVVPQPMAPMGTLNGTYVGGTFGSSDFRSAYLGSSCPMGGVAPSACQALTGKGQVVGVFSYVSHNSQDIAAYDNGQSPAINPNNVLPDVAVGGTVQAIASSTTETPLDIEMVQAMAPAAKVLTFDEFPYGNLWGFGHVDGAFHAMATSTTPLTVATNSWIMGRDSNEQQALYEMAMQGVSFFEASGDLGNIDDPQDVRDLDDQTLVGGTYLSLTGTACGLGYGFEDTWNGLAAGKDITGGGVMDGHQNLANVPTAPIPLGIGEASVCECWPYPFCCGPGVAIPYYQITLQENTNLNPHNRNQGSTIFRNYPDVSMVASNLGEFANGAPLVGGNGGTSGSAPLWAGFMALANELSVKNHAGTIGFANPMLYEIGQTRGDPVNDLYASCFNDINDGVTNGIYGETGLGDYPAVAGYDLATGLGTPNCNLIFQMASTTPLTPHTPLYWLEFQVTTGHDDLRSDSAALATVRFHNGAVANDLVLKPQGPEWNNGAMVSIAFDLTKYIPPADIPKLGDGIDSITMSIRESGRESDYDDNWDVSGLNVRLVPNPGGDVQEACQFDIPGTNTLQDGHPGVARFSASNSGSGVGVQMTFATPEAAAGGGLPAPVYPEPYYQGTGVNNCLSTGAPTPPSGNAIQPGIQFIFSTGNDNARQDSGVIVYFYDSPHAATQYDQWQLKTPGEPEWQNDTQQNFIVPLKNGQVPDHIDLHLQQHNQGTETDDKWNVNGVNIVTWQTGGPEVCYYRNYQSTGQAADGGDNGAVFTVQDNYVVFYLSNCHSISPQ